MVQRRWSQMNFFSAIFASAALLVESSPSVSRPSTSAWLQLERASCITAGGVEASRRIVSIILEPLDHVVSHDGVCSNVVGITKALVSHNVIHRHVKHRHQLKERYTLVKVSSLSRATLVSLGERDSLPQFPVVGA